MSEVFSSLQGKLLLDGGELEGSAFHRSVVLICRHNPDGAFGLVLNKPRAEFLGDVLPGDVPPSIEKDSLFDGGPVQPTALSYLHSDHPLTGPQVIPDLELAHELDDLLKLGFQPSTSRRLRVFAGYAGWSKGQLDQEIRRKSWLIHPASLDLVFAVDPEKLWRHILLQRSAWEERLLANSPERLSNN